MSAVAGLLIAVVALPALGVSAALPSGREVGGRLGVVGSALATVTAAALAIVVAVSGPVFTGPVGVNGSVWVGLVADRLTVALLVLVCAVSTVVQLFACRQLQGDSVARHFSVWAGVLTAATATMVSGASLVTLALGWSLAGVALVALVGLYRPAPAAREAAWCTARMVLVGDAALWTAVAWYLAAGGQDDLRHLGASPAPGGVAGAVIGCLLVVPAAARCAQMPFHRWLSASLAAPTPVSALLHAGVVNAGGILLVRLHPIVAANAWATWLTMAMAGVSVVAATLIMLARPDVKGALVYSTIGQMAFMLLACAMGLLAAAVAHLMAHGMYKATLFLGSGSVVDAQVRHLQAPPAAPLRRARAAAVAGLALVVAAGSVIAAAGVLHPEPRGGVGLLAFATVTAAAAGWGWLRLRPTRMGVAVLVVGLPVLVGCYLTVLSALTHILDPVLAAAGPGAAPVWTLAAFLVLLAAAALLPTQAARGAGMTAWLYARVLAAGQHPLPATRGITVPLLMPVPTPMPAAAPAPAAARALVPQTEGVRP